MSQFNKRQAAFSLFFLIATMALLFLGGPARAQVGSLEVQVLDARDAGPLPGANVTLSNDQGFFATATQQTGPDGRVRFAVLRAVSGYSVEVAMPGFATHRLPELRVRSNETERVDVMLTQELQERVEVTARRDVVQLDEQGSTTRFDDTFIENLPVPGRFYQNMLSLAPGVNDWDEDGNPNVHGARTREFRATVGGVSNTDPLTGEWLSYINPESIEEMEILTAGAGVEHGRASGGFARIVQRQGSNSFEGLFTFIYRSSDLDGNGATGLGGQWVPDYEWVQPGILLSGPIVKDKLWYRLSHEYLKKEDPINFVDRVEIMTQTQQIIADQITWQISPRNKLAFQYQKDPIETENYGLDASTEEEATQTMERGGPTYSVTWTAPYSSNLLVDTVVAYQNHKMDLTPTTEGLYNGCVYFPWFPMLNETRCFYANFARVTGSHNETVSDRRQRFTVKSQATLFNGRLLGMPHRFKVGLEIENERYYRELDRGPDLRFFSVYNPFGPDYGYVTADITAPRESSGSATGVSWSLYAEDQFRPANNLTLTLGLRMDREEIDSVGRMPFDPAAEATDFYEMLDDGVPVYSAVPRVFTAYEDVAGFQNELAQILGVGTQDLPLGATAQQSAFWQHSRKPEDVALRNTNYSPRFSVAWDPWGDGKTKIAATAGRYYDKIFLGVPLLEVEPPRGSITWLAYDEWGDLPWYTWMPMEGVNTTVNTQVVDRELNTPYQDEYSFSLERMLWPETSIKLTYIKRDYQDQLQDVDINHRSGDEGRCVRAEYVTQPSVVASDGEGQLVVDPYTFEEYTDTDPGPGDGRIDDCMGEYVRVGGSYLGYDRPVPDGKPDMYVLNPGWGDILLLGNFNTTEYEAFVLELVRRQYRNWQMHASYTWSEAVGQAEDFTQVQGNERNLRDDEWGPLAYDQRHVVRVSAVSLAPWGLRFGGTLRWESGLPFSELFSRLTAFNIPLDYGGMGDRAVQYRLRYPTGQRNDQRNPSYWTLDLRAAKEFRLSRQVQMQLTAEVFNLFNDQTLNHEDRIDRVFSGVRRFGRHWQLGMRVSF